MIKTSFGFHIILVTEHRPEGRLSYEQAKPLIVARLFEEKKEAARRELLEKLIKDFHVERTPTAEASTGAAGVEN